MRMTLRDATTLLVVLPLLLAACSGATPKKEVEPEPTPKERLIGTWRTSERGYWVDDQFAGNVTETLTFTGERWISYNEAILFDGTVADYWAGSGGWSADQNTITRLSIEYRDDEPYDAMTDKDYVFGVRGPDGDTLVLRDWDAGPDRDTTHLLRYQRLENVLPDLAGVWTRKSDGADDDLEMSITLNADGTFRYHSFRPERYDFVLEGRWTHDAEKLYINLSEITGTNYGEPTDHWIVRETTGRFGYAPMGDGGIVVSGWWNEPPNPERDPVRRKYGTYYHRFYK